MLKKFGKNANENKLSSQLLIWLTERVPPNDPLRISDFQSYQHCEDLGNGRFGQVCKYLNKSTKTHETVKKVKLEVFDHWTQDAAKIKNRLNIFIEEFRNLHKISNSSDRIVNFLGIYSDDTHMYIMSEYLERGSVKERIMRETLSEDVAIKYLMEALEALHYLHNLHTPIVHRDIKAANLLITKNDSIKLTNFGLIRDLAIDGIGFAIASEITLDFRGTLLYVAPEVLSSSLGPSYRQAYQLPADIWALGCTFIEMLLKYPPHFEYFGHVNEIPEVLLGYAKRVDGKDLPYSAEVLVPSSSKSVQKLVDAMLVKLPEKRPNTKKLKGIITHILRNKDAESDDEELTMTASTSSEELNVSNPNTLFPPRKFGRAGSSLPIETIENGVTIREKPVKKRKERTFALHFIQFIGFYSSRLLYFLGILSKSVAYLLLFLALGIGVLCIFLFLAYSIVRSVRYAIGFYCECDLMAPQYLIISGILIVLLFALLFSCCMVALGEYKFRMANRTLRESRFFIPRPEKSAKLCGVTVLPGKESSKKPVNSNQEDEPFPLKHHDDYYYDTP